MFEFIKKLFKREEIAEDPKVEYVDVERAAISRTKIINRDTITKTDVIRVINNNQSRLVRARFMDTGELVEMTVRAFVDEVMANSRPVKVEGFVD